MYLWAVGDGSSGTWSGSAQHPRLRTVGPSGHPRQGLQSHPVPPGVPGMGSGQWAWAVDWAGLACRSRDDLQSWGLLLLPLAPTQDPTEWGGSWWGCAPGRAPAQGCLWASIPEHKLRPMTGLLHSPQLTFAHGGIWGPEWRAPACPGLGWGCCVAVVGCGPQSTVIQASCL